MPNEFLLQENFPVKPDMYYCAVCGSKYTQQRDKITPGQYRYDFEGSLYKFGSGVIEMCYNCSSNIFSMILKLKKDSKKQHINMQKEYLAYKEKNNEDCT